MTWIICFIGTEVRSLHYRQPANGYMCTGSKTASRQSTASLPRLSMMAHNNGKAVSILPPDQRAWVAMARVQLGSVNILVWSCLPFLVGFD